MPRLALYPGSFDPVTNGHLDVLRRALRLFDRVEVTVGVNVAKHGLFSAEERIELIEASTAEWSEDERARLSIETFDGLIVDRAKARRAVALVRGLRQVSDFDYEMRMAVANRRMAEDIVTLFLTPEPENAFTSASLVREIHRFGGDVSSFVPPPVLARLRARS